MKIAVEIELAYNGLVLANKIFAKKELKNLF